jgi:hypothetical protein
MKPVWNNCRGWLLTVALGLAVLALGCGHESAASPGAAPRVAGDVAEPQMVTEYTARAAEPATGTTNAEPSASEPTTAKPASENPENDAEPRKKGQPPPADRTPRRPGDAEKITFDDLNIGMPANILYRPFMLTDRVKELDGTRISIIGFIHGAQTTAAIKEFVLLKNTECKFGKDGQADHLAMVYLKPGTKTSYTKEPVKVEGKLRIEPFHGDDSGITWAIYHLDEAVVK